MTDRATLDLAAEEVVTWWSQERGRAASECADFLAYLTDQVHRKIDGMTTMQTFPGLRKRYLESEIKSNISDFVKRMDQSMSSSCTASLQSIGDFSVANKVEAADIARYSAIGLAGAGSIGVAAASTGLATATTTTMILGFFAGGTIVTFSWPIFGSAAFVALGAATIAGLSKESVVAKQKARLKKLTENALRERIIGPSSASDAKSILHELLEHLDSARDARLSLLE